MIFITGLDTCDSQMVGASYQPPGQQVVAERGVTPRPCGSDLVPQEGWMSHFSGSIRLILFLCPFYG